MSEEMETTAVNKDTSDTLAFDENSVRFSDENKNMPNNFQKITPCGEFSSQDNNANHNMVIVDSNKNTSNENEMLKHNHELSDRNKNLDEGFTKSVEVSTENLKNNHAKIKQATTDNDDSLKDKSYEQRKEKGRFRGNRSRGRGERNRQRSKKNENAKEETTESIIPREVGMKNPVMMLNEMYPPPSAPQYKVTSQTGPPNNPTFSMVCCLLGKTFSGSGKSKKEAKLACSQAALEQMFGQQFHSLGKIATHGENPSNPRCLSEIDDWLELEGKNPISILNELYPGITFSVVSSKGPSHAPQFCVRASLGEVSFEGFGKSKKDAKLHASKALLVHLHKVGFDPMTGDLVQGQAGVAGTKAHSEYADGHSWADRVGRLVVAKFDELFGNSTYSKRKVMAGIVVAIDGKSSVICVSSGTKCINGEQLSLSGTVLNDCHAEIVARRCLLYWLYDQLEKAATKEDYSILVPAPEGGYAVRTGVSFHLFISTSPCGDARIFSLHEEPVAGSNILTGPRVGRNGDGSRGKLRSKIESGMGTVPLPEGVGLQQTWDGVMSGERLLTMACSDKILRWNVVGVQGSLLTHWLRPVYLSSITVGSRYHPGHMSRALHDRSRACGLLPEGFTITRPELLATTSPESRQASKAQEYSVNWIEGLIPEVVNGSTGKTVGDTTSRISKKAIFEKFIKLAYINGQIPKPSLVEVLTSKSGIELVPKTTLAAISDISGNPEMNVGTRPESAQMTTSQNASAVHDGFRKVPPPPFQPIQPGIYPLMLNQPGVNYQPSRAKQLALNQSMAVIPVFTQNSTIQSTGSRIIKSEGGAQGFPKVMVPRPPVSIAQRLPVGFGQRPPVTIAQRPPVSTEQRMPVTILPRPPVLTEQRMPITIMPRPPVTILQRPADQRSRHSVPPPIMDPRSGGVPNRNSSSRYQVNGSGLRRCLPQASQKQLGEIVEGLRYDQLKAFATGFSQAKERLVDGLTKSGAGIWVKKPIEQDQFSIWRSLKIATQSNENGGNDEGETKWKKIMNQHSPLCLLYFSNSFFDVGLLFLICVGILRVHKTFSQFLFVNNCSWGNTDYEQIVRKDVEIKCNRVGFRYTKNRF